MKRIGWIAVWAALAAAPAHAQRQFEPAVPKGIPSSSVEPSGVLSHPDPAAPAFAPAPRVVEPVVPHAPRAPHLVMSPRHRSDAEVRQCLRFASNRQIARCAEPYSPRHHQART